MADMQPNNSGVRRLGSLLPETSADVHVSGITLDSREVEPGWLYAALPGQRTHGARFAAQAVERGAVAVLTDRDGADLANDVDVPVVVVDDARRCLGEVAAAFYGNPSAQLTSFGVTGTNGKTTTVALIAEALRSLGNSVGTIGTLGARLDGVPLEAHSTTVTTPEAPDLQQQLAAMRDSGAHAVALEVSSHALSLERVRGIQFDVVGFINLGQDHLDYHRTIDEYFAAKCKLFESGRSKTAVIWTDDDHGAQLAQTVRRQVGPKVVTVGTRDADWILRDVQPHGRLGMRGVLEHEDRTCTIELALPGRHNMVDAAIALVMLDAVGIDIEHAAAGLQHAQIPGRMQRAMFDDDAPLVIVDFAHTPQAVGAAVEELSQLGPLTTVVGSGGDRDPIKRPLIGAAAAEHSDLVVITDDNPRTEDPAEIRAAVYEGALRHRAQVVNIGGRADAIAYALEHTPRGGVVAILGKGHERGQILADKVIDFDDVLVARAAWGRIQEGNR